MSDKPEKIDVKKSFLEKHPPKSPEEIEKQLKDFEEGKKQYTQEVTELEQNLKDYANTTDPLVDPATNKPLCWVKRPTRGEFEKLIPPEMLKYRNSPESVPQDIANKYDETIYELMAQLIVKPKHNAAYWRNEVPTPFLVLFQQHIAKIYEMLGISVENF